MISRTISYTGRPRPPRAVLVLAMAADIVDREFAGELQRFSKEDCCDVCREVDGELVYCSSCEVAVHSHCYGAPLSVAIPEGDWICDGCTWGQTVCALCPRMGGAMKRTTDWRWAHIGCAIWVPEVYFRFADRCDALDLMQIPANRYTMECFVCKTKRGAAFKCSDPSCSQTFHVPCAMVRGVTFEYKEVSGAPDLVYAYCCKKKGTSARSSSSSKFK
ncbi:PHD-type domain-containing protein [Plasmodiophora brassicae]|nr:hypothetical protein PBRA_006005 [Plasmodiophora brassicae]